MAHRKQLPAPDGLGEAGESSNTAAVARVLAGQRRIINVFFELAEDWR